MALLRRCDRCRAEVPDGQHGILWMGKGAPTNPKLLDVVGPAAHQQLAEPPATYDLCVKCFTVLHKELRAFDTPPKKGTVPR